MPTIQKTSGVLSVTGHHKRCSRNKKRQKPKCALGIDLTAFLNHSFTPLWQSPFKNDRKAEQDFLESMQRLCLHYNLHAPDHSLYSYPDNVVFLMQELGGQLEMNGTNCMVSLNADKTLCIVSSGERYHIGNTLHYIPVSPLWSMINRGENMQEIKLITSIFAYLYRFGVPYFTGKTYISGTYDMLRNWIEDERACEGETIEEYYYEQIKEIDDAKIAGEKILIMLRETKPSDLSKAVKSYRPINPIEISLHQLSKDLLNLSLQYPAEHLSTYVEQGIWDDRVDRDVIDYDQIVSFYWNDYGEVSDNLMDTVNLDLQEKCYTDEPGTLLVFDKTTPTVIGNFRFIDQLFSIIAELPHLLNELEKQTATAKTKQP